MLIPMNASFKPHPTFYSFARMFYQGALGEDGTEATIARAVGSIKRAEMPDFIEFVQDIVDGRANNQQLQAMWSQSQAHYFTQGATVRQILIRAKEIAESRGMRGRKAWIPHSS